MKRWLFALLALVVGCGQVDPGERAVFVTWGEMTPKCFTEGLYFYNPISTDMWEIDAKEQRYEAKADAGSKDLQDVHVTIVVNYTVDGGNCHTLLKTVGTDFLHRIVQPAVQEVVKANTPKFDAEHVIQKRADLKNLILTELRDRLTHYGISVKEIALTNISFTKEFQDAITRKSVQQQEVQTAKLRKDQAEQDANFMAPTRSGLNKLSKR
jgi:regulator of protease activity HflC (stomatin/prohibitin superfamily)